MLTDNTEGLILLTDGVEGGLMRLLAAGQPIEAEKAARRYRDTFGPERTFIELQHHRLPDAPIVLGQLTEIAEDVGLSCVATNGVYHATHEDCAIYDVMTCTRLGITVDQPHVERPSNEEAWRDGRVGREPNIQYLHYSRTGIPASASRSAGDLRKRPVLKY